MGKNLRARVTTSALLLMVIVLHIAMGDAQTSKSQQTWQGFVTDTHCGTNCQVTKNMAPDKKCVNRCVREGSKYGLWVGNHVYEMEPQSKAAHYAASNVSVAGTLVGETIHINSIEPSKQGVTTKRPGQFHGTRPANWTLYRNSEYGFEIQYPPNWTLEVEIAAAASNFTFTSPMKQSGTRTFLVQINPHLDYSTLQEAVDSWQPPGVKPISKTDLTINGYSAIQVIEPANQIGSEIFFFENRALYGVSGDPHALEDPDIAAMLSTLRFIQLSSHSP